MAYQKTLEREAKIRAAGYRLVVRWQHEPKPWSKDRIPNPKTVTYPHAIVYDFESYLDKTSTRRLTEDLTLEGDYVPISVSLSDTLDPVPEHLCNRDPKLLIEEFMKALQRRATQIREDVRHQFLPDSIEFLPKKRRYPIEEWCDQVPVLGFNSGKYDLNLIRNHFVGELCKTTDTLIKVGCKANQIIFITTPDFKFLDIINYIGPGKTYDAWVKAYGCAHTKYWFPYEWFDSPEKLDFPSLPDYPQWYSKLKASFL